MRNFLADEGLPALLDSILEALPPVGECALHVFRDRVGFIRLLQETGVAALGERQAIANALARWSREGRLSAAGSIGPDFRASAEKMTPSIRALLVEGASPTTVSAGDVLRSLGLREERPAASAYPQLRSLQLLQALAPISPAAGVVSVLHRPGMLSPEACDALRRAVDANRTTKRDSVDGGAEHQLDVSRADLERLCGASEVAHYKYVYICIYEYIYIYKSRHIIYINMCLCV